MSDTDDFLRRRLDQMTGLRNPFAVFAASLPWQELEVNIDHLFAKKLRAGKVFSNVDLLGCVAKAVSPGVLPAVRPHLPLRLKISLLYPKQYSFNEIVEAVVERWHCNPHLTASLPKGLG